MKIRVGLLADPRRLRALAGLAAYQAILLTPVLAVYLFEKRRKWIAAWAALYVAPLWRLLAWQLFELATSGALPAAMLAGYMKTYGLQTGSNKLHSAAALIVHSGWIVSPIWSRLFLERPKWRWIAAAIVAARTRRSTITTRCSGFRSACGVLLLSVLYRRGFLGRVDSDFLRGRR